MGQLFDYIGTMPIEQPPPVPDAEPNIPQDWVIWASFLRYDARKWDGRMQGILSATWSDAAFEDALKWHKKQGDNTLFLAMADQGDNGAPVTMYSGGVYVGGNLNDANVQRMLSRMIRIRQEGFRIVAWLTMDDSPAIHGAGTAALVKHARDVHGQFGDHIAAYCIGLEIDEDKRRNSAAAITAALKELTKQTVYAHMCSGANWKLARDWGCDGAMLQYGFGSNLAAYVALTKKWCGAMDREWPGARKVAGEYSRDSDEGWGEKLIEAGAVDGYGNG